MKLTVPSIGSTTHRYSASGSPVISFLAEDGDVREILPQAASIVFSAANVEFEFDVVLRGFVDLFVQAQIGAHDRSR